MGESVAAWYLSEQGLQILDRNVSVLAGEVDLVANDRGQRVVIEVRSTLRDGDPIDSVDSAKRERVGRLARSLGAQRVDLVGIGFGAAGICLHWVPDV